MKMLFNFPRQISQQILLLFLRFSSTNPLPFAWLLLVNPSNAFENFLTLAETHLNAFS